MWIETTLALRFLKQGRGQTLLILVGIAVGVAVIVFVTALVQGLQDNIIDRTLGTQAHIRLLPPDLRNVAAAGAQGSVPLLLEDPRAQRLRSLDDWPAVRAAVAQVPGVVAVSPLVSGPAFVLRGAARTSVVVMGVELAAYTRIVPLGDDIVAGHLRVAPDQVMVGSGLARDLGVRVGSRLRLDAGQGREALVDIAGIFELGVRELDERYVYMDLRQAQALLDLPGGVTVLDVAIDDIFGASEIAARLGRLTRLKAESWMQTNSQLMNALRSQSLSTNMISFFVAISVAFGIASVLAVSVTQRTREIGILRAMGTRRGQMLQVFLIQGAVLGALGAVGGGAAGYTLVQAFNRFGPGLFEVPVAPGLLGYAVLLATLTGVAAAAAPAWRAARLDPVVAIRHV